MKLILTSRPFSILKPMSWVNATTRAITNSPFDHVALLDDYTIFESAAGEGVNNMPYRTWIKDRKGSYLFMYNVPSDFFVSFNAYYKLHGRKYDYKANILFLLRLKKKLKKCSTKRLFCSELIATMFNLPEPYLYTPCDIEEFARQNNWKVSIRVIE